MENNWIVRGIFRGIIISLILSVLFINKRIEVRTNSIDKQLIEIKQDLDSLKNKK